VRADPAAPKLTEANFQELVTAVRTGPSTGNRQVIANFRYRRCCFHSSHRVARRMNGWNWP